MIDMTDTIHPKSDQLNADDLIGGPRTIRVTKVSKQDGTDQPIIISFHGDGGKPYKPCLSMRRVLVRVWGKDGAAYVGRAMTLFRDDKVQWAGAEVGGIRISHVSHIKAPVQMALTESRKKRVPFRVFPLDLEEATSETSALDEAETPEQFFAALLPLLDAAQTDDDVHAIAAHPVVSNALSRPGTHVDRIGAMIKAALARTAPADGTGETNEGMQE